MVISSLAEGLGNQLFQYAAGRALALRLGATFRLDTLFFRRKDQRPYVLDRFRIAATPGSFAEQCALRVVANESASRWTRKLGDGVAFAVLRDEWKGYDSRFDTIRGNVRLAGFWQSERYFADFSPQIREEFQLKDAPDAENRRMLDRIMAAESVALHVRRADYVEDPELQRIHGACGITYYRRAIAYFLARLKSPCFFVFSDDPDWAEGNLTMLPDSTVYLRHNNGKADAEDLRLMMHCRHFIIANSSFSWWGAWLSSHPEKQVIAPERWFKDPTRITEIVPERWTRLSDAVEGI